jgi:hypothetical protein
MNINAASAYKPSNIIPISKITAPISGINDSISGPISFIINNQNSRIKLINKINECANLENIIKITKLYVLPRVTNLKKF